MAIPLKYLREQKGITQAELGLMLNISPSTVGMWEQGRREPDYNNLKRLADIFNVSTDYLLGYNKFSHFINLTNEQIELLNGFYQLNDESKKALLVLMNQLNLARTSEIPEEDHYIAIIKEPKITISEGDD